MHKSKIPQGFKFELSADESETAMREYLLKHHNEEIPSGCRIGLTSNSNDDVMVVFEQIDIYARGRQTRT